MEEKIKNAERRLRKEQLIAEFKDRVKRCGTTCREFYLEHQDEIKFATPLVLGGAAAIGKHVRHRKAKNLKENYCYDRSLGHYWSLRRTPSNREWLEIDRRKRNGERLADILSEMRLLK